MFYRGVVVLKMCPDVVTIDVCTHGRHARNISPLLRRPDLVPAAWDEVWVLLLLDSRNNATFEFAPQDLAYNNILPMLIVVRIHQHFLQWRECTFACRQSGLRGPSGASLDRVDSNVARPRFSPTLRLSNAKSPRPMGVLRGLVWLRARAIATTKLPPLFANEGRLRLPKPPRTCVR